MQNQHESAIAASTTPICNSNLPCSHQSLPFHVVRVEILTRAFKCVTTLHACVQIPTALAENTGEAGAHVQSTLSMTARAAARSRVTGEKCWVMRRWRLASEKESWWGHGFRVSSTIAAPESWPSTAAESEEGGRKLCRGADGEKESRGIERALVLF